MVGNSRIVLPIPVTAVLKPFVIEVLKSLPSLLPEPPPDPPPPEMWIVATPAVTADSVETPAQ